MKSNEIPGFPCVKIRRNCWPKEEYIELLFGEWKDHLGNDIDCYLYKLMFLADDWELFKNMD